MDSLRNPARSGKCHFVAFRDGILLGFWGNTSMYMTSSVIYIFWTDKSPFMGNNKGSRCPLPLKIIR